MKASVSGLALAFLFATPVATLTYPAAAQDGSARVALPACISVSTDARYVPYGYNHVVILKNGCAKAATCSVATDVNPQPILAEVTAGSAVEVVTFRASPAAAFRARVSCGLH